MEDLLSAAPTEAEVGKLDAGDIVKESSDRPHFETVGKGSVLLRYKFRPDEKVVIKMALVMNQVIFINEQTIRVQTVLSMEGNYTVKSVKDTGDALAMITITRIRVNTKGPAKIFFDSDSKAEDLDPRLTGLAELINTPLNVKVSPLGRVSDIDRSALNKIIESAGEGEQLFDLKNICEEFIENTFIALSKKEVKTGDTYEAGVIIRVMPDGSEIAVKESCKILEISGDNKMCLLQPRGKFSVKSQPAEGMKIRLNNGAKGGWILFDLEKGNIVRSGGYSHLDVTLGQKGQSMRMKTDAKMSFNVQ
ncbi:hypothetical protein ACFL2O_07270 [Thermodesulfobacteriota bacterium]